MLLSETPKEVLESMTAFELVKGGFCDPVAEFIKDEPHKQSKIASGALRLVSSISLEDSLVERFFAKQQNKTEILNWSRLPSTPGFGVCPAHIKLLVERLRKVKNGLCSNDVIAFDFQWQSWEFDNEAKTRVQLAKAGPALANVIFNRFTCLKNKVYLFSDGSWSPVEKGVLPSGSYLTSSSNSRNRITGARIVRIMFDPRSLIEDMEAMANGDDCLEDNVLGDQAFELYRSIGNPLKECITHATDMVEFCSTHIDLVSGKYWSTNMPKCLARYFDQSMGLEQTAAMIDMAKLQPTSRYTDMILKGRELRKSLDGKAAQPNGPVPDQEACESDLQAEAGLKAC